MKPIAHRTSVPLGTALMKKAMRDALSAKKKRRESFMCCGTRLFIRHQFGKYFAVMTKRDEELFRLVEEPNGSLWIMET